MDLQEGFHILVITDSPCKIEYGNDTKISSLCDFSVDY